MDRDLRRAGRTHPRGGVVGAYPGDRAVGIRPADAHRGLVALADARLAGIDVDGGRRDCRGGRRVSHVGPDPGRRSTGLPGQRGGRRRVHPVRDGHPGRCRGGHRPAGPGLPGAGRPARCRVLRTAAPVSGRRGCHGLGQRSDRAVPGPRGAFHRRLCPGGHAPPAGRVPGGGHQVLRARGFLLGLPALRDCPGLRGHRFHQPGSHQRPPGLHGPGPGRHAADRFRPGAGGLRLQGGRRAVPRLDPRRLPGCTHPGGGLDGRRGEGGRLHRPVKDLRVVVRRLLRRLATRGGRHGWGHRGRWGDRRRGPDRREADAGLLVDRPRRVHPDRRTSRG